MIRLLKIELRKIISNRTFWILTALYIVLYILVILGLQSFIGTISINGSKLFKNLPVYRFPDIWHNITYIGSFFKLIPAFLVIIFITNEYSFNTIKQNITSGLSRNEFVLSKVIFIFMYSTLSLLIIALTGLLFGCSASTTADMTKVHEGMIFLLGHYLQLLSYLSLAMFISVLIRKAGLTIVLLLAYSYIIEPLLTFKLPEKLAYYFPVKLINNLITIPFKKYIVGLSYQTTIPFSDILASVIYIAAFTFFTWLVIRKRDL